MHLTSNKLFVIVGITLFIGCSMCQKSNRCIPNPCWNNGTCNPNISLSLCNCITGYTGVLCDMNGCIPNNPCQNSGNCSMLSSGSVWCSCPLGYKGNLCEINICSPSPCKNGGSCSVNSNESPVCTCPTYITGQYCQITPCTTNPCQNGGTCGYFPNQNYFCNCPMGYTGSQCQNNACASNPCLNGGTCAFMASTGTYTCKCSRNFYGTNCERKQWYSCFSLDDYVILENGHRKPIVDCKSDDIVKSVDSHGKLVNTKLVQIWHINKNLTTAFVKLKCDNDEHITLTLDHLINVDSFGYKMAENVQKGDKISFLSNKNMSMIWAEVIGKEVVIKNGYIAPITETGTIIVNGFDASCYAGIENHHFLHFLMKVYLTLSDIYNSKPKRLLLFFTGSTLLLGILFKIKSTTKNDKQD